MRHPEQNTRLGQHLCLVCSKTAETNFIVLSSTAPRQTSLVWNNEHLFTEKVSATHETPRKIVTGENRGLPSSSSLSVPRLVGKKFSYPWEVPLLCSFNPVPPPRPFYLEQSTGLIVRYLLLRGDYRILHLVYLAVFATFLPFASLLPQKTKSFGVFGVWWRSFEWWRNTVLRTGPTAKWTRAPPIQ